MTDQTVWESVDPVALKHGDRVRVHPVDRKPRVATVETVELHAIVTVVSDKTGKRHAYNPPTTFDLLGSTWHPDEGPLTDSELRSLEIWHGPHGTRSVLQRAADEIKSLRAALYRCEADKGTT
jgi:hypothetical protein